MTEATKHKMTMAKATEEEWQAMLDFFQHLEANVFVDSEYELGEYVREQMDGTVGAGYNRVLWGYKTMVDSVCDPELSHLELKPELRNLKAQRDEALAELDAVREALASVLDEICNPDGVLWVEIETPMHHQKARKMTRICKKARKLLEEDGDA